MAGFGKRKTKAEFRFRVTSTHSWYRGYWRKTGSLAVRNVYPKADSGRPGREFVANPDCPATSSSGRATSSRDVLLGRCRSRQIKTRVQRVRGPSEGSGASRDFGPAKTSWRVEDPQAAKQKCLISSRCPSLTRVPLSASAAERRLLSADAPEPIRPG